jgi:hypothetical protein
VATNIIDERRFGYDKKELAKIIRSFKAMDEVAQEQAKREVNALAEGLANKIQSAARSAPNSNVASRVADGIKVSSTSKVGEIRIGFAQQKFSGGATTQFNLGGKGKGSGGNGLLAGAEFGSKNHPQFAPRTARFGRRGNTGYFIYPTLRDNQSAILAKWEEAFSKIVKEWTK